MLLGLKGMTAALLFRLGSLRLALAGGLVLGAARRPRPRVGARSARAGPTSSDRSLVLAATRPRGPLASRMTELARDLYLLVAVLGLLPAVALARAAGAGASAFVAVGGVGALQLERAGLPIGGAVLLAIALGAVGGRADRRARSRAREPAVRRAVDLGAGLARLHGAARLPVAVRRRAGPDAAGARHGRRRRSASTLTLTPRRARGRRRGAVRARLCAPAARLRAGPAGLRRGRPCATTPSSPRSLGIPIGARRIALLALAGGDGRARRARGSRCCSASPRPRTSRRCSRCSCSPRRSRRRASRCSAWSLIVALPRLADWSTRARCCSPRRCSRGAPRRTAAAAGASSASRRRLAPRPRRGSYAPRPARHARRPRDPARLDLELRPGRDPRADRPQRQRQDDRAAALAGALGAAGTCPARADVPARRGLPVAHARAPGPAPVRGERAWRLHRAPHAVGRCLGAR